MNLDRIKILERFAKDDPDDPFPIYAMALEWMESDVNKARELFDIVLQKHPDYLPVYYQAAVLHINAGESATALRLLEVGIQKARATGESKLLSELQGLLDQSF